MSDLLRSAAEHEAAHAVVARVLDIPVWAVEIRADGSGVTYTDPAVPGHRGPIVAAGDLWQREFGTIPYRDGACSDLRAFEEHYGLGDLWRSQRDARKVLERHHHAVLRLADRLMDERRIGFT